LFLDFEIIFLHAIGDDIYYALELLL